MTTHPASVLARKSCEMQSNETRKKANEKKKGQTPFVTRETNFPTSKDKAKFNFVILNYPINSCW